MLDSALVAAQAASGLSMSAFLVIHLAAPAATVLGGGPGAASSTMLLGRELYQTSVGESLLWASAGIHVTSGLLRRVLRIMRTRSLSISRPRNTSLAGYLLLPFSFLHVTSHRILPATESPPISSLSPSQFDYSFVTHSFHTYPVTSLFTYIPLVTLMLYHSITGLRVILSRPTKAGRLSSRSLRTVFVCSLSIILGGLARLASAATDEVPSWLAHRYDHVLISTYGF